MPKFVQHHSGLRIEGVPDKSESFAQTPMQITLYKLPKRIRFDELITNKLYVSEGLSGVITDRANGAAMPEQTAQVKVSQEVWNARTADGVVLASGVTSTEAAVRAQGANGVASPAANKPLALAGVV